ncbi:MAG: regulatory protein GemA [Zoogloeaceae bacterium]|jgi:hypothetical protein|nr:regulatory protein GemA [Zoogloeaceae bacterium]
MSTARITPAAAKQRILGGIRAECARQGIDDDTRRSLMARLAGVRSSKDLTLKDAKRVLMHLQSCSDAMPESCGRRSAPPGTPGEWKFVFAQPKEKQLLLKKIFRLAETIGGLQTPPVPVIPKAWVEGIIRQMRAIPAGSSAGPDKAVVVKLELCATGELATVVQAMAVYVKRHKVGGASSPPGEAK